MTKTDDKIIGFISTFEMYEKEESGIKPNTIRIMFFAKEQRLKKATHIKIRKGYTKEYFVRKITDKTKWKNDWIISWNPNEELLNKFNEKVDELNPYPKDIFTVPTKEDYKILSKLLQQRGLTLDRFSADVGRKLLKGFKEKSKQLAKEVFTKTKEE